MSMPHKAPDHLSADELAAVCDQLIFSTAPKPQIDTPPRTNVTVLCVA